MKKALTLALVTSLVSTPVNAKTFLLTSTDQNIEVGNWKITSQQLNIKSTPFTIEQKILHGGKQEGSKILTITDPNGLTITLSPTRGMDLLRVNGFGVKLGWDSPVKEVINPAYINLESRNGAGWLEGFNEMIVRCGFEWTGHPSQADGQLYTLHGKAGNTPASEVEVEISDHAPYEIRIRGLLKESTFKKADIQTLTELRYIPGSSAFIIHDVLTNHADYPHDYQIIYHSNFSKPILEKDAYFIAPIQNISPFNEYAKKGISNWSTYLGPTKEFDEMVFNIVPYANTKGDTLAAVINKEENKGVSIAFNVNQLPFLTLWKNTDTEKQGYVTGIEPGTNYAYPVSIERAQKRIKQIQPGQNIAFDLTYTLLHNKEQIDQTKKAIQAIQENHKIIVNDSPIAKE